MIGARLIDSQNWDWCSVEWHILSILEPVINFKKVMYTGEGPSNKLGMEPSSNKPRTAYTSDVSDAEWDFCRPYLVLMKEDAPQRDYRKRHAKCHLRVLAS